MLSGFSACFMARVVGTTFCDDRMPGNPSGSAAVRFRHDEIDVALDALLGFDHVNVRLAHPLFQKVREPFDPSKQRLDLLGGGQRKWRAAGPGGRNVHATIVHLMRRSTQQNVTPKKALPKVGKGWVQRC